MREQFANNASSTLDGAIDDSQTTITVDDGSTFPDSGNFRLICESEYMLCTARSGETLTVVRGIEGSTAAAHTSGTRISHILTLGGLRKLTTDNVPWADSDRAPFGGLHSSQFTTVNGTGATITDANGYVTVSRPSHSGESNTLLVKPAPAAPYKVDIAFQHCGLSSEPYAGLAFFDSNTERILVCAFCFNSSINHAAVVVWRYGSPTSFSGTSVARTRLTTPQPYWQRAEHDGENLKLSISPDGINWIPIHTEAVGAFITPDSVGFAVANLGSSIYPHVATLLAWREN